MNGGNGLDKLNDEGHQKEPDAYPRQSLQSSAVRPPGLADLTGGDHHTHEHDERDTDPGTYPQGYASNSEDDENDERRHNSKEVIREAMVSPSNKVTRLLLSGRHSSLRIPR